MLCALRGATTVPEDTPDAINCELTRLLQALVKENPVRTDAIVAIFFTVTPDLTSVSPAKIARVRMKWGEIPMLCAQEPVIDALPPRCIRVLIQFESDQPRKALQHVYQNEAVRLRPDLFPEDKSKGK